MNEKITLTTRRTDSYLSAACPPKLDGSVCHAFFQLFYALNLVFITGNNESRANWRLTARLKESQALKLAMPSKLYLNVLQDKVKKRRGGNPINVNRLSKN